MWDDHLALVLSSKSTKVMQEACQVLEEHGYLVMEKLRSEFHYMLAHFDIASCASSTALFPLHIGTYIH